MVLFHFQLQNEIYVGTSELGSDYSAWKKLLPGWFFVAKQEHKLDFICVHLKW